MEMVTILKEEHDRVYDENQRLKEAVEDLQVIIATLQKEVV